MFGLIREYFNIHKYGHAYSPIQEYNTFHVYKEGGYHLYDLIVFVTLFIFLGAYFYTVMNVAEDGSIGYMCVVVSIIAICAMLF